MVTDGVQQNGGKFAGIMSGVQHTAKERVASHPEQAGQHKNKLAKDQHPSDAGTVDSGVELLALLNGSPQDATAAMSATPATEDAKKTDACADSVPKQGESSGVASQVAMAAYLQSGKLLNVTVPAPQQTTSEQPAEKNAILPVTQSADKHAQPLLQSAAVVTASATTPQPVQSDRMSDINKTTSLPVDGVRNTATETAQLALVSTSPDKIQVEQKTSESAQTAADAGQKKSEAVQSTSQVRTPITLSAEAVSVPPTDEPAASQGVKVGVVTVSPAEKTGVASSVLQSGVSAAHSALDMQSKNSRTGDVQNVVKETASSLQTAVSSHGSALSSDTSHTNDNNQQQSESGTDNTMLEQQMRGQVSMDHQKVAPFSIKTDSVGTTPQDISGQVVQQLKENLTQHVVKPGNHQITLTLSPDSLGEIKVNLSLQGQKLSVTISTQNETVRNAIAQHTDALKESLARQNITMQSFDVTTGGKGSGNHGQNQSAWRELAKQQQQYQSWTSPGYHIAQADLSSGQAAYQKRQGQSMLDIHY
ncbi:MAG: flagellar hook-length control protein FliK [Desulfuromonadaceae bacterium]|nr:flagellar hook-length control protein FliK [Desulfuromonadaceae bacterium]